MSLVERIRRMMHPRLHVDGYWFQNSSEEEEA
ncbi:MAG: hypothetical protein DKINENOH_00673 [bacterium]|nr:hypothetical protein [bacterium]